MRGKSASFETPCIRVFICITSTLNSMYRNATLRRIAIRSTESLGVCGTAPGTYTTLHTRDGARAGPGTRYRFRERQLFSSCAEDVYPRAARGWLDDGGADARDGTGYRWRWCDGAQGRWPTRSKYEDGCTVENPLTGAAMMGVVKVCTARTRLA